MQWDRLQVSPENHGALFLASRAHGRPALPGPWWLGWGEARGLNPEQKGLAPLGAAALYRQVETLQSTFSLCVVTGVFQMGPLQAAGHGGCRHVMNGGDLSQCQPLRRGDVCYCILAWLDLTDTLSQIPG